METLQKKEPNFERHDIDNTPFSIIKETNTGKCKITIANYLMYDGEFENEIQAKEYIEAKPWDLILNTTYMLITNIVKDNLNTQNND